MEAMALSHIELFKAEAMRDAKTMAADVAPLLVGMPLLGVGYVLACVALGLALGNLLGGAGGFAIVGGLNLVGGSLAVRWSVARLRRRQTLVQRAY